MSLRAKHCFYFYIINSMESKDGEGGGSGAAQELEKEPLIDSGRRDKSQHGIKWKKSKQEGMRRFYCFATRRQLMICTRKAY